MPGSGEQSSGQHTALVAPERNSSQDSLHLQHSHFSQDILNVYASRWDVRLTRKLFGVHHHRQGVKFPTPPPQPPKTPDFQKDRHKKATTPDTSDDFHYPFHGFQSSDRHAGAFQRSDGVRHGRPGDAAFELSDDVHHQGRRPRHKHNPESSRRMMDLFGGEHQERGSGVKGKDRGKDRGKGKGKGEDRDKGKERWKEI
jgi:hypothetical protein